MELKSIKVDVLRRSIYWVSKSFIAHCTEPFILYSTVVGVVNATFCKRLADITELRNVNDRNVNGIMGLLTF